MRNTDEQLDEIMRRAGILQEKRSIRNALLADGIASGVCLALLIAVIVYLPSYTDIQNVGTGSQYGSLLLASPYLGYVIIGLLSFALGICLTLLCWHLKKRKEREQK